MMKGRPSYAYSEKLMKQMGWTEGKGLGKNEDGMPDFIRPKKKVNTKGIGFNGVDDRWIEHQEAFDILLSNLNNGNPAAKEDKLIGVEERAFKLGGRVHYSKFLRGKDLSQKKKEDLNAIVVKRKKYDAENVQEADATSQEDLSGLKTYTSSMSYQEYFAQRMKASRRHKGLNEDGDLQSYEQTEETRGEDSEITSKRKHKRYEKDEKMQDEWTSHVDEEVVGAGLALNRADTEDAYSVYNENVQAKKKKKKKSKHKSYDGGDSQWSETITEQREDRLSGDSVPEECSLGECVSKRKRKLKHADDSEQTFHEATMSQMGFHSKYSVPDRVKKKSKHDSHIGTENQWTETIISPVECSVEEDVPKRLKKSKRTVENSVENNEQVLPKTAASQMEFCSEDSVPRVKKKSKHKPDRDTTGQKFETNDEQWDDGNRSSLALAETLTSSTKHIVHKSEEAAPKRTKKLKRQPRSSTDDAADGSLQALTEIVPTTEFSSEEHQQQVKKKSKHRPARGTVEEDQPEIRSKKAAVASLADRAAKEEVSMLPLQTSFEEEMPKRATKRPKQKAPEVTDETSRLKIQTESVKAKARKESNQQQEGVVAKKRKQEPEQNEVPEDKTKKISKQHQTGGLTPKEPNPEQERNEAKAQFKTDANENPKQKLMSGKTSLKQEKAAQTASKLGAKKSEKATTKLVARKPMQAGGKVVSKKLVQLRQNVEYEYGRATRPAAYNAYRPTMRPEASTRRARHPTSLSGQRGSVKHSAGNGVDSRYRRYDAGKAARDFIASRKKIAIRNSRVGNAARKHQRKAEPPRAWRLDIIQKGMWRPLFKPDVKVQPVDDDTAATMAQWVVDTVEGSDSRVTPAKACHLDKETFAMALADHIYMQHNASNWMHIPGYGSKSWVEGCVNLLFARMLARNQNQASESFVQSTANSEKKASGGSTAGSRMRK